MTEDDLIKLLQEIVGKLQAELRTERIEALKNEDQIRSLRQRVWELEQIIDNEGDIWPFGRQFGRGCLKADNVREDSNEAGDIAEKRPQKIRPPRVIFIEEVKV